VGKLFYRGGLRRDDTVAQRESRRDLKECFLAFRLRNVRRHIGSGPACRRGRRRGLNSRWSRQPTPGFTEWMEESRSRSIARRESFLMWGSTKKTGRDYLAHQTPTRRGRTVWNHNPTTKRIYIARGVGYGGDRGHQTAKNKVNSHLETRLLPKPENTKVGGKKARGYRSPSEGCPDHEPFKEKSRKCLLRGENITREYRSGASVWGI